MPPPLPVMSAKLLRGALVEIDPKSSSQKTFIPFQYNPAELSRTLTSQLYTKNPKASVRFIGVPTQSISLKVKLEAIGAMAAGTDGGKGIYAQLAALELLLYPSLDQIKQYREDANSAKLWAVPPQAPRTVFVWGPDRALPVQLKEVGVKEELFDNRLSPISAEVDLKMDLLQMEYAAEDDYQLLVATMKKLERAGKKWATDSLSKEGMKDTGTWYT